ncbi:hypothetical protein FVE85_9742 [Porphyridium purpureum]|uniref:Uncharacterized protein n=1 Tax=Porphyridium purpureum TaxID=35688 RepID=A0A5J4YKP8_PORPP|nr:hypothetical protein FVE85_9742 [Porphyridium purpureum]|eukprot:POR2116..scf246_12
MSGATAVRAMRKRAKYGAIEINLTSQPGASDVSRRSFVSAPSCSVSAPVDARPEDTAARCDVRGSSGTANPQTSKVGATHEGEQRDDSDAQQTVPAPAATFETQDEDGDNEENDGRKVFIRGFGSSKSRTLSGHRARTAKESDDIEDDGVESEPARLSAETLEAGDLHRRFFNASHLARLSKGAGQQIPEEHEGRDDSMDSKQREEPTVEEFGLRMLAYMGYTASKDYVAAARDEGLNARPSRLGVGASLSAAPSDFDQQASLATPTLDAGESEGRAAEYKGKAGDVLPAESGKGPALPVVFGITSESSVDEDLNPDLSTMLQRED